MLRVAILIHRHSPFESVSYWLAAISKIWRESGIEVNVIQGPQTRIEADIAVLHVDMTVVPDDYLAFVRQYPAVLNGGVADISKRLISAHRVYRGDGYDGPVIVKTDRNNRGVPEAFLAKRVWSLRPGWSLAVERRLLSTEAYRAFRRRWRYGSRALHRYRVFDSARDVPDQLWRDPELIVERFLSERRNGHYCIRSWLFLGDQERHALFYATDPLIKSHNIVGHEPLTEIPDALRQRRRELKFDFGKFDYAMVDGEPVLYDANPTPAIGSFPEERYRPIAELLAAGIGSFR